MREQIAALLDEGLGGRGTAYRAEDCRVATQIADHVHELGDGVHGIVVVRDA
jgi:hypothetical protein